MTPRLQHVRKVTGVNENRAEMSGQRALDKMADDFRVSAASADSTNKDDLELLGWLPEQVEKYGRDASRLATRQSIRRRAISRSMASTS